VKFGAGGALIGQQSTCKSKETKSKFKRKLWEQPLRGEAQMVGKNKSKPGSGQVTGEKPVKLGQKGMTSKRTKKINKKRQ